MSSLLRKFYHFCRDVTLLPYFVVILFYLLIKLPRKKDGIVIVGPSLTLSGAPLLTASLVRQARNRGISVIYMVVKTGPKPRIESDEDIIDLKSSNNQLYHIALCLLLCHKGYSNFILNSIVSAQLSAAIGRAGGTSISIIHEMAGVIRAHHLVDKVKTIAKYSSSLVFSSFHVYEDFKKFDPLVEDVKCKFHKQGLYNNNIISAFPNRSVIRDQFRDKMNLPKNSLVVVGVGSDPVRKGYDYFLSIAYRCPDLHFVWVGDVMHPPTLIQNFTLIKELGEHEIASLLLSSDCFFLSSIEDPFPTVVLESLAAGIPVIAFAGTGGAEEIITDHVGLIAQIEHQEDVCTFLHSLNSQTLKFDHNTIHQYALNFCDNDAYLTSLLKELKYEQLR